MSVRVEGYGFDDLKKINSELQKLQDKLAADPNLREN
jgi:hypothetical protein